MKKVVLLAIGCIISFNTFSQSFMHAGGISLFIDKTLHSSYLATGALTYSPRINMVEHANSSVSVGIPLSIGYGATYYDDIYDEYGNNISDIKDQWFLLDVPVIVNYNWGALSTADNNRKLGFFIGGGLDYHLGPVDKGRHAEYGGKDNDLGPQSSFGPVGNLGVRIYNGSDVNFEIRLSYAKSMIKKQADIFSLGLIFILE